MRGNNPFEVLNESEEEDLGSDDPPPTPSVPASPPPIAKKLDADTPTLSDLCRRLDDNFHVPKKQLGQWRLDFDTYDTLDPAQYDTKIQTRLQTFSHLETDELLATLDPKLSAFKSELDAEFQGLVARVSRSLAHPKQPNGHSLLFLLGRGLRLFPPLYRKLEIDIEHVAEYGPVVAWLLAYLVNDKPDTVAIQELIRLYGEVMMNTDVSFAPVSVALSHVMRDVVTENTELLASDYFVMLSLSKCARSHRDKHVAAMVKELRRRLSISDTENFPKVLMTKYREHPQSIISQMVRCCLKMQGFVDGWVATHREMPLLSKEFLKLAAPRLPTDMLEMFSIEDLREPTTDNQQLALKRKKLQGTSTRFTVLILVAAAVFGLWFWVNS
jgi:hypothetical protein